MLGFIDNVVEFAQFGDSESAVKSTNERLTMMSDQELEAQIVDWLRQKSARL